MKFWILSLLIYAIPAFSQTDVQFKESIFGDKIIYKSIDNSEQKIFIHKHNISKESNYSVILLHGCGGLKEHYKIWVKQLTEWNYNVIVIDSYTSRGMPNGACTNWPYLRNPPDDRVEDLFATAEWIKTQSWNKGLPAVVGFSHGGNTVYLASNSPKSKELLSSGISFYPYCWYHVKPNKEWPLQIHVGSEDEWNPAATCIRNERRQSDRLEFHLYWGAHHSWDTPGVDTTIQASLHGTTVSSKRIKFDEEANRLSRAHTKRWLERHFN
jgi:dienelactone hydrolase